jgi:DNA/RNA-binding domain of Phe-tRNA-synthetase-like protein
MLFRTTNGLKKVKMDCMVIPISGTDTWRRAHPGGRIGLLEISNVVNASPTQQLEIRKREVEASLRERYAGFSREDFIALPVIAAYREYYRQFKKTYHVLLQVESIVIKGRNLPQVSPLVDANFTAEVETFVLTAGHDAALLHSPVVIDASKEGDRITQMNGETVPVRPGDMVMRDAQGISCSIIYGQDNRSMISPHTIHALYVAYAPPGMTAEAVAAQLDRIASCVRLFSPSAVIEQQRLLLAE